MLKVAEMQMQKCYDVRPDSLETMAPYKFITYLLTYVSCDLPRVSVPRKMCVE